MASILTPTGVVTQDRETIAEELISAIEASLGTQLSRDKRAIIVNYTQQVAEREAQEQEGHRTLANALDPANAEDARLDAVNELRGLARFGASKSTIAGTFTGTPATAIPSATTVRFDSNASEWSTTSATAIGGGGTVDVILTAELDGPTEGFIAGPGGWTILDVIAGVDSFQSTADADKGAFEETNSDFKQRGRIQVSEPALGIVASMEAAAVAVQGVNEVRIRTNLTTETVDSVPPGSTTITLDAPNTTAIKDAVAAAIAPKIPPNTPLFGPEEVIVDIGENNLLPIKMNFVAAIPIFIQCTLTVSTSENKDLFLEEFIALTKTVLLNFGNDESSGIGQDVLAFRFEGAVSATNIQSVDDVTVLFSLDGITFPLTKVSISNVERADYSLANITVLTS